MNEKAAGQSPGSFVLMSLDCCYAGVQQMLYIVNALRVECEEWRVELMAGHPRPFRSAQFEGFDALDKPHCHLDFLFCHLDRSGEIPRLALGMA